MPQGRTTPRGNFAVCRRSRAISGALKMLNVLMNWSRGCNFRLPGLRWLAR